MQSPLPERTAEQTPRDDEPPAEPESDLLLPNVMSLPAEDIEIRQTDDGRELRFTAALANVGDGPLVLAPDDEPECPEGERHASQVVYRDADGDGVFDPEVDTEAEEFPAGCMVFHPDHDHWHFDASAAYTLTAPDEDEPVAEVDKVSFCMRDSRTVPDAGVEAARETYEECERDDVQGVSVGWADVYDSELEGQALDLPDDMSDGVYCLRLTADPYDLMQETDDEDNSSAVAVEITGDDAAPIDDDVCEP